MESSALFARVKERTQINALDRPHVALPSQ